MSSKSNASAAAGAASQSGAAIRFEWGVAGVAALGSCSTMVIVDVLSFTTCVTMACESGAQVIPWRYRNTETSSPTAVGDDQVEAHYESAEAASVRLGTRLAQGNRDRDIPSLCPASMRHLLPGERLLLPSPNGATLAHLAVESSPIRDQQQKPEGGGAPQSGERVVVASCLRNAAATGRWLAKAPGPIAVIAAGERWPDQSLRPALEDFLGAGAVISALLEASSLTPSAEAASAAILFDQLREQLPTHITDSVSGQELTRRGFTDDLALASDLHCSEVVPVLDGVAFSNSSSQ